MNTPHEQKINPSSEYSKHDWRWMVLEISPNSNNSVFLNVLKSLVWIPRWICWILLSSPVGNDRFCSIFSSALVHKILNFLSFFLDLQALHLVGFFEFWVQLQNHALPTQWVSMYLLGLACQLICLGSAPQAASRCLFVYLAAAVAFVASISRHSWEPPSELAQAWRVSDFTAGTESWSLMAWDLVCPPKKKSHFLCPGQVDPADDVLMRLPFAMKVYFYRFGTSLLNSSSGLSPKKKQVKGVKKTACCPSFPFPPTMSRARWIDATSEEHPRWNKNSFHLDGIATWPISSGAIKFPSVCPGIARIYIRTSWEILQYWNLFFCSLLLCSSQAEAGKVFSEMRSAVLDRSISNEQHHQFLFLLGHGGAPTSHQVQDSEFQSMSFEVFIDKNVIPRSLFTWNKWFGMIFHQIRLNCWLRRMSFPSAQWYLHFHWTRFHFHRDRFPDAKSTNLFKTPPAQQIAPPDITTQVFQPSPNVDGIQISIPKTSRQRLVWTWRTGPNLVCPSSHTLILELGSSRGDVYSLHAALVPWKPSFHIVNVFVEHPNRDFS